MKQRESSESYNERLSLYKPITNNLVERVIKKIKDARQKRYFKDFLKSNLHKT